MDAQLEVVDGDVAVATVRIDGDLPGLFVVDALGRLTLAARRLGYSVRLRDPSPDLADLLALCGLGGGLGGQDGREPERGEVLGAEEVVQPDEPPA